MSGEPRMINDYHLQVAGAPADMVPKKANLFSINGAEDGHVILECLYTNGQVLEDGTLYAYCPARYYIAIEDLIFLRDAIDRHLEKLDGVYPDLLEKQQQ